MMDVVGGHHRQVQPCGHFPQQVVAPVVLRHTVIPDLDVEALPEHLPQAGGLPQSRFPIPLPGSAGYRSLPATAQRHQISSTGCLGQVAPKVERAALGAPQLRSGDQVGKPGVSLGRRGQHHQVIRLEPGARPGAVLPPGPLPSLLPGLPAESIMPAGSIEGRFRPLVAVGYVVRGA